VTQNIYVNVREGQSAPPPLPQQAPPAPPPQVHYHTTNVYHLPRRRGSGRGTSFLGSLGFVLGALAIGATYVPQLIWLAKPIATAGAVLAGVGLLGASLLGRVGRGVPLLGLLACALAYGLWMKDTGQPIVIPKLDSILNATPAVVAPPPPPTVKPVPAPATPVRAQDHSIFGDGFGTPPAVIPPVPAPAIGLATATANLETARDTAARRMGLDYQSAKSSAADAATKYQQAKIDDAGGSPQLIAASQQHLQADSQLNLIEEKLRSDPAVAAAEAALKSVTTPAR
jgi:hypothetical protein